MKSKNQCTSNSFSLRSGIMSVPFFIGSKESCERLAELLTEAHEILEASNMPNKGICITDSLGDFKHWADEELIVEELR